eukprot:552263-Rhodomonas_salina.1
MRTICDWMNMKHDPDWRALISTSHAIAKGSEVASAAWIEMMKEFQLFDDVQKLILITCYKNSGGENAIRACKGFVTHSYIQTSIFKMMSPVFADGACFHANNDIFPMVEYMLQRRLSYAMITHPSVGKGLAGNKIPSAIHQNILNFAFKQDPHTLGVRHRWYLAEWP